MKPSGIGGQAVIEGVMMRNKGKYAVAVRKPDKEIVIKSDDCESVKDKNKLAALPIVRGVVTFVESLYLGIHTLTYSASFFEEEDEEYDPRKSLKEEETPDEKKENIMMALSVIVAVVIAIGIFFLLPYLASELLRKWIKIDIILRLLEGVIRVALFVIYVKAISLMKDIKRVFMYHGAEHKSINCIENGCELTVENVKKQSMAHKRCGTSFLLVVMLVSILFFLFISVGNFWLQLLLRLLLIPVVAGVAYEFIYYAGRHDNAFANALSKPGLLLQKLTTLEPSDSMIEVAIASVEEVFDWREFLGLEKKEEPVTEKEPEEPEVKKEPEEKKESTTKKKRKSKSKAKQETKEDVEEKEVIAKKNEPEIEELQIPEEREPETQMGESLDVLLKEDEDDITVVDMDDEEEDEILKALDRYFEDPTKEEES